MARPEVPINWDLVDELLLYQNSGAQIASHFGIHPDTFYRRFQDKYGENFVGYAGIKYTQGKSNLLKKQFQKAINDGNVPLLLKLGEIYLDQKQTEIVEQKIVIEHVDATSSSPSQVQMPPISGSSMECDKE